MSEHKSESGPATYCDSCRKLVFKASTQYNVSYLTDLVSGKSLIHKAVLCEACRRRQRLMSIAAAIVVLAGVLAVVIIILGGISEL